MCVRERVCVCECECECVCVPACVCVCVCVCVRKLRAALWETLRSKVASPQHQSLSPLLAVCL